MINGSLIRCDLIHLVDDDILGTFIDFSLLAFTFNLVVVGTLVFLRTLTLFDLHLTAHFRLVILHLLDLILEVIDAS